MTDPAPSARRYDDDEFLSLVDAHALLGDDWVGTHRFVGMIGCKMLTANRRLIALAKETDIEVYDPEAGGGDTGEAVDPESFEKAPARELGFRREPDEPESAPDYLDTGYTIL